MAGNWEQFCNAPDFEVEGPSIAVRFAEDQSHTVTVQEQPDTYVLNAMVARQGTVSDLPDLSLEVWLRNRAVTLVGFRIDRRGRLVGEAWVPKAGLDAGEFQLYVRTVAIECDRFRYLLTGG
jgi:hypothetical protein